MLLYTGKGERNRGKVIKYFCCTDVQGSRSPYMNTVTNIFNNSVICGFCVRFIFVVIVLGYGNVFKTEGII